MQGCSFELSPSFSLSFFAPKLAEGTSTKKLPFPALPGNVFVQGPQNLVTTRVQNQVTKST